MARDTLEDTLASVTNALEEVADDHLYAYEGEHHHIDAETAIGHSDDGQIVREEMGERVWEKLTHNEACDDHDLGTKDGEPQGLPYTVVLPCTPIVANDGLHTLIQSHDHHQEEEDDAVDDAVSGNGRVATVLFHAFVDKENDQTGAEVHEERTHTHGDNLSDDAWSQSIDSLM